MTNTTNGPITRKTLARKVGGDMTVDRLKHNEDRWGLRPTRVYTGTKSVLYREADALAALKKVGMA